MLRFDPFRELDRRTEQLTRPARSMLAMDAVRDEHEVTIYIDAPGATADDVDVSVEKNEVTVSIERRWHDDTKQTIAQERPQGTFTRRFMLSDAVDLERLVAKMQDGVLTISVPVSERSKPRRIDIKSGGESEAIEATSA